MKVIEPDDKNPVYFEHNSAGSQMVEAYLNHFGGDRFFAEGAGLEPGTLNPYFVEVLGEEGLDMMKKA